jgi:hypothetical protein
VQEILDDVIHMANNASIGREVPSGSIDLGDATKTASVGKMKIDFAGVLAPDPDHLTSPDWLTLYQNPVIPGAPRTPSPTSRLIEALIKTRKIVERAGFGYLWYGRTEVAGPRTASGASSGRPDEYAHWTFDDEITIFGSEFAPDFEDYEGFLIGAMVHELGHRFWYKFMSQAQRLGFASYFGKVKAVSNYGSTNESEDFAETFMMYVLGDLRSDQRSRFLAFTSQVKR